MFESLMLFAWAAVDLLFHRDPQYNGAIFQFLIPAAASLIGGAMSARSVGKAADTNAAQQQEALALQQRMYEEGVARQQPFLQTGTEFFNRLAQFHRDPQGGSNLLMQDPGYQFRLGEGLKSLDRQAAARGGLISGAALRAAQRYGQDVASQEFGNAYNRLASMAQIGPQAAGIMTNMGQNFANQATGIYGNIGQTNANAQLARGSAYTNALGSAARSLGGMFGGGVPSGSFNMPEFDSGTGPY